MSPPAQPKPPRIPRFALLAVALLLPAASLMPLGTLWLWERGAVAYWGLATCAVVTTAYYFLGRLLTPPTTAGTVSLPPDEERDRAGDTRWTDQQLQAWHDVLRLGTEVKAERLSSREAVLGLGLEAVELVARRLHPERADPLLQFTVPEALAVVERASRGYRDFLIRSFPLGDRITVAQLMWLYRWRGALNLAEKGYDLWRVVRLLNPLSAATQELRERFTRQIYDMGREHLARRLARAYVKEVGRAAIDLYGGNLKVTDAELATHVTQASARDLDAIDERTTEPIRLLVAGQAGAGKSSLVNALANTAEAAVDVLPATRQFTPYKLTHEGLPSALIVDSPGLTGRDDLAALMASAADSDLVLWVSAANRAARDIDRTALEAMRANFAAQPNRRRPPMLLVLTHIDTLRPFNEWDPPYDLTAAQRTKSQSILAAMQAAGDELGFSANEIVPVRVDIAVAPYNADVLWARILDLVPEAQRARLLRSLGDIKSASGWKAVWSQAANAGRVIRGTFLSRTGS